MDSQRVTSKNTSVNKIAAFYKKLVNVGVEDDTENVFDYGCGRYFQKTIDFAKDNGFSVYGYDKYNQTMEDKKKSLDFLYIADIIACNNVLNVLEDDTLNEVIDDLRSLSVCCEIPVYITVYEGDKSGQGRETKKDCYQRHERVQEYVPLLEKHFDSVTVKGGIIRCI